MSAIFGCITGSIVPGPRRVTSGSPLCWLESTWRMELSWTRFWGFSIILSGWGTVQ